VFESLLKKLSQELNLQSIPYMVIGGQAVLVYGEPRLTKDIDITLGINVDELDKLVNLIKTLNLNILVDDYSQFVKDTLVLPTIDEITGIRIDFVFSYSEFEKQAIKRAKGISIENTKVNFASLEDLVIHKIISARPRDIEDIKSVVLKNPNYDSEYIIKWLREFDLSLGQGYLKLFEGIIDELDNQE